MQPHGPAPVGMTGDVPYWKQQSFAYTHTSVTPTVPAGSGSQSAALAHASWPQWELSPQKSSWLTVDPHCAPASQVPYMGLPDELPLLLPELLPDELPLLLPELLPDELPLLLPELLPDELPLLLPEPLPDELPLLLPELLPDELPLLPELPPSEVCVVVVVMDEEQAATITATATPAPMATLMINSYRRSPGGTFRTSPRTRARASSRSPRRTAAAAVRAASERT